MTTQMRSGPELTPEERAARPDHFESALEGLKKLEGSPVTVYVHAMAAPELEVVWLRGTVGEIHVDHEDARFCLGNSTVVIARDAILDVEWRGRRRSGPESLTVNLAGTML